MRNLRWWVTAAAVWCSAMPASADIVLAGVTEATGGGAAAGISFRNGYTLAVEEINAAGGLLGQQLVLRQFDIDTKEDAARKAVQEAVNVKPLAVLGPVFSGLTVAAMQYTSGIPHFTGGEAASITRKFHSSVLRTSLTQQESVPRLSAFAVYGLGASKIGLMWVDNEFGRNGRTVLQEAVRRRGASLVLEESVASGQKSVTEAVQRLMKAQVDALVLLLNEDESVLALKELKRQGFAKPIVGDGPLLSPKVVEGAQGAAEGVIGHTGISVELVTPRMTKFVADYQRRFGSRPDHNSVKGYFAVQALRIGVEAVGRPDRDALLQHLKNSRLDGRSHPAIMTSVVHYDMFGDLNRDSYVLQVRGGKPRVIVTMGALDNRFVELPGGRSLALSSDELRREVQTLLKSGDAPTPTGAKR